MQYRWNSHSAATSFPFTVLTLGAYGAFGRDSLIAPNLRELHLPLFKTTSITERVTTQFRVEGFNLSNRANFGT
jgi:hypothetical protein